MENLRLIYEQIEEAKKYLRDGSLLRLRLALILLDNVAELLMYKELQQVFARYDHWEPKWETARLDWIRAGLGPKYTKEERTKSEKEFEPKLRILQFRLGRISQDDRNILCVCHKLRCEAFHRGRIRRQILGQVCRVLYRTVTDLTVKLPVRTFQILGGKLDPENAGFLERFGCKNPYTLATDEGKYRLREKLVEDITIDGTELATALSEDLVERIDATIGGLAYIGESDDRSKIDYNLQHTQFWRELGAKMAETGIREPQLTEEFEAWRANGGARFTLSKIDRWNRMALAIARYSSPATAVGHYWAIERSFAPLEEDIAEAVWRYDEEINARIHDTS